LPDSTQNFSISILDTGIKRGYYLYIMARNRDYEKSPIRGSSKYQRKMPGDLIKDRSTGELILVIERLSKGDGVAIHCRVQYIGENEQERLATWFVDYECERV
jgi:hypothetical protein